MVTEENIIYQLLEVIRAYELNNDEVIGERDLRALLVSHRSELLKQHSLNGMTITDMCFQQKALDLDEVSFNLHTASVPAIVFFQNRTGTKLTTQEGYNIPIVSEESFDLGQSNPINKHQPKAKIENQLLSISTNTVSENTIGVGSGIQAVMDSIRTNKKAKLKAVLVYPEDGDNYDWTVTEYPFPSEYLSDLKKNLLRREFNIVLSTKSDQVPNMKNDTLRYHDQSTIQR